MARIVNIALNTFRESIRGKLLYIVLVFGAVLIISTYILSPLSVGAAKDKIITDVGLAFISFFGVMTAVVTGSTLVHKEIDKRAVYMVLTRPVSRLEYLVGKFSGIMAVLVLMVAIMSVLMGIVVVLGGGSVTGGILAAIFLSLLEMAVICSIVLFFSTFTTPVMSFFFTVCFFVAGSLSGDLRVFAQKFGSGTMKFIMDVFYYILPNLRLFNLRNEAVHQVAFQYSDILLTTVYAAVYCAVIIYFSYLVFRKREFV
jgi:ABC-type transport system involved in multi-copper enzyme maturation permease subunit